jgi:ubiquinone/menaquinone biosynthesis C-methylase UbiE
MTTENTSSFTGSIPENYDRGLGPLLFDPFAIDLAERIEGDHILDALEIACGTGRVTHHIRKAIPLNARLIATDLNPDMIAVAKSKYSEENIEWQTCDAQDLPFDDDSFDLVVCQFGIMFVPEKQKAFSEVRRVLRKGGMFLFNTWDKIEFNGPVDLADKIVTSYFEKDPPQFYKTPFSMHDSGEIEGLLKKAGFKNVRVDLVKKEAHSDSVADVTDGLIDGNPVYLEIQKKDPKLLDTIKVHLQKELVKKFGDSPLRCSLQAWVCSSVK